MNRLDEVARVADRRRSASFDVYTEKEMFSRFTCPAACTAILLGGGIASADTITLEFLGAGPKKNVDFYFNGDTGTVKAGVYNWSGGLETFCVQLMESVSVGDVVEYKIVDPWKVPDSPPDPGRMGQTRYTLVMDLYARWYDTVMSKTGNAAKRYAAAFAMNIWEITHQDANEESAMSVLDKMDFEIGNARFSGSNSVNNLANEMLESLGGGAYTFLEFQGLYGLKNVDFQDQLAVEMPVPGPAGLAGALGLWALRRRRR